MPKTLVFFISVVMLSSMLYGWIISPWGAMVGTTMVGMVADSVVGEVLKQPGDKQGDGRASPFDIG